MPNMIKASTKGAIYWVKKDSVIIFIIHFIGSALSVYF
ncbi:hypothetical protein GPLA_4389 [Paraglaciecola polaris LMG 21857]|uniref:Uncharacterized protein n=1 Tax=Paraglaciecola polaris LMG 21857 TaxID=1129793 RepID=K7A2Y2_9ALTE|nr:hypothetical protein GPLA_4389 [Paraglaciecola polaris LMG 21857]